MLVPEPGVRRRTLLLVLRALLHLPGALGRPARPARLPRRRPRPLDPRHRGLHPRLPHRARTLRGPRQPQEVRLVELSLSGNEEILCSNARSMIYK